MREWLRKMRKNRKMTQTEVANSAGIVPSQYSMIETGSRRPSIETAQAIAKVLDFDWQLFFPQKREPDPSKHIIDTA